MNPSLPIKPAPGPDPPVPRRKISIRRVLEVLAVVGFWLGFLLWFWKWFQSIWEASR